MFKVALLLVAGLAIVAVSAQEGPAAAPEPYSYGYESENHGASESRDPNGKVTGYYFLTDADGRQRRVEYYADESGFHAKVQTNEVGTKSESSADVEVQAAPPTQEQLVYQASGAQQTQGQQYQSTYSQQAPQAQRYYSQQVVSGSAAPARAATYSSSVYQQPGYQGGYQGGYQAAAYPGSYGYGGQPASSHGSHQLSTYNNHLPSQYYKSLQVTGGAQPGAIYGAGAGQQKLSRYSSSVSSVPATVGTYSNYQTAGGQIPIGGTSGYQSSRTSYSSSSSSSSAPAGSSNYIVLKKRDSEASN